MKSIIKVFIVAQITALMTVSILFAAETADKQDLVMKEAWRAGRQMVEAGLYHRGVDFLNSYLAERPKSTDGLYWLAKGYQGMGKLKEAQAAFTKVLEIDPEYPQLSRVLQNRANGEAIPLWDRSGGRFRVALPVIDPGKDIYEDHVEATPAPIVRSIQTGNQTYKATAPVVDAVENSSFPAFSAMGAKKIVLEPQGTSGKQLKSVAKSADKSNPVVPIPPVKSLTGEPEGPGIPSLEINDKPIYIPPTPETSAVSKDSKNE